MDIRNTVERLRLRLAGQRGALVLAALGIACGVLAGAVTVAFRATIEIAQRFIVPRGFDALTDEMRLALPVMGAVLALLVMIWLGRGRLRTGVAHVLERLSYNEGQLPLRNAALQFFGGALVLIFGMALGREGPSVHLGAASGSQLGRWVRIPHNSLRTLVGCGVAAAIAASFNTPLAGVAFALEVVLMEFAVGDLTPVILAAVSGATVGRLSYGSSTAFLVPPMSLVSLWELPYIVAMGVAIGALAAAFIVLVRELTRATCRRPWWLRIIAAGVLIGGCGVMVPEVMGIGYDTVNLALVGRYALGTLAAIAAVKLFATGIGIAAGLPGGLIGPSLVMGAAAGGVMGHIGTGLAPVATSEIGLYAMLGMGAMMGATLQAPLAALLALIELTGDLNIVLPGMLAVVSATLVAKEVFACESVFIMQMRALGLDHSNDPVAQKLRRIGVTAVMSRAFRTTTQRVSPAQAATLLEGTPQWIVVAADHDKVLLLAADLARHLESGPAAEIDLLDIPAHRRTLARIHGEATLQAGLDLLERANTEALYVEGPGAAYDSEILGVLTREQIDASYRYMPAALPAEQ
ncbi:MAG: chloride channel protein [Betaproteobacteria bacterium]|nr:MAG: chloride channel protein [Betaproteobacteria bacterium]